MKVVYGIANLAIKANIMWHLGSLVAILANSKPMKGMVLLDINEMTDTLGMCMY